MTTGWLIFIAVVLIIIVLFQVTRTLDLISQLKEDENEKDERNAKAHGIALFIFMILGVIGYFWCFGHYSDTNLPESASEHGVLIEDMFLWTLYVTSFVFIICNIILFAFSYIYRYKRGREVYHFSHSNKLELIWTVVPTIVLTGLVIFGLDAWTKIMSKPSDNAILFEVTGQQFFWSSRYPGEDGKLGLRDYNLICPDNPLGVVAIEYIEHRKNLLRGNKLLGVKGEIEVLQERKILLPALIDSVQQLVNARPNRYRIDDLEKELDALEDEFEDIDGHIKTRELNLERIEKIYTEEYILTHAEELIWGYDDFMPTEIHLPIGKQAQAKIVALDVLHDFYIPHMKVKMDAVPGMPTSFVFKPIISTAEMRIILSENPYWQQPKKGATDDTPKWKTFDYEIACAELCGTGHSAMKYILVVDSEADYEKWLLEQTPSWNLAISNLKISELSSFAPKLNLEQNKGDVVLDSIIILQDSTTVALKK